MNRQFVVKRRKFAFYRKNLRKSKQIRLLSKECKRSLITYLQRWVKLLIPHFRSFTKKSWRKDSIRFRSTFAKTKTNLENYTWCLKTKRKSLDLLKTLLSIELNVLYPDQREIRQGITLIAVFQGVQEGKICQLSRTLVPWLLTFRLLPSLSKVISQSQASNLSKLQPNTNRW